MKLDADTALHQLVNEVGFPAHLWEDLANGLMLGGETENFCDGKNSRNLQRLITYWVDNDEDPLWQQLVDAVAKCGQRNRAKKLAKNVGAIPPSECIPLSN